MSNFKKLVLELHTNEKKAISKVRKNTTHRYGGTVESLLHQFFNKILILIYNPSGHEYVPSME